jgi:hypothetical protein
MNITDSLTLPPEVVSRTIAILAQKGAGKTYTAMKLAELLLGMNGQVVALDPTGVWWGLKAEGTGPGFPILVMGGEHGDLSLPSKSGAVVADFVVESGQSVVLDLSGFESNAEQDRFVTDFAERLFRAKAKSRSALHLMLDEADAFAPQRCMPGQQRMLGAIEAIVRRGRSRGLGMTMISQRPAVLNKNILTQADLLVALRVVGVQDHKALGEWTSINGTKDQQRQFLDELPSLPTGEAFFWSPSWLNLFERGKVLPRQTFDSSATPVPGAVICAPKLAKIDIERLSAKLLETTEAAKSDSPAELRAEIARLQKASDDKVIAAYDRGYAEANVALGSRINGALLKLKSVDDIVEGIRGDLSDILSGPLQETPRSLVQAPMPAPRPATPPRSLNPKAEAPHLNAAQSRVLVSLFWLRNEERSPVKVAFFARYTVNGHFNNLMGQLRAAGLVEGWSITEKGICAVPCDVDPKPTGMQLREWLREKITGAENKLLDVLMKHHGRRVSVEDLASQAGYTVKGHFNNSLGHLRTLQIAEGGAKDGVKASDVFFQ